MGQIKSPVSLIVYKFHIKQSKDRSHRESGALFLTSLIEVKFENRKYGFEHSQAENRLDVACPAS